MSIVRGYPESSAGELGLVLGLASAGMAVSAMLGRHFENKYDALKKTVKDRNAQAGLEKDGTGLHITLRGMTYDFEVEIPPDEAEEEELE